MKHPSETEPANTITEMTRRTIIDYLSVGRHWSGVLQENDFLGRLYDLKRMSSTDYRPEYDNAAKDIWKPEWRAEGVLREWLFAPEEQARVHVPQAPGAWCPRLQGS